MSDRAAESFAALVATMHRLRAPGGCPWDAEQTHASLRSYVIEEAYELCEAIERGGNAELAEELGDVLLQVVFHAELASERAAFTIADVVDALVSKLVRRHPHVFADHPASTSAEVVANWARIKAGERRERETPGEGATSAIDGVPRALPSLLRGHRLGERAGAVGFDWPDAAPARLKIDEELAELDRAVADDSEDDVAAELGDVLFAVSNYARLRGLNGELLLHGALDRFERRFRLMEADLAADGRAMTTESPAELEHAWQRAKRADSLNDD